MRRAPPVQVWQVMRFPRLKSLLPRGLGYSLNSFVSTPAAALRGDWGRFLRWHRLFRYLLCLGSLWLLFLTPAVQGEHKSLRRLPAEEVFLRSNLIHLKFSIASNELAGLRVDPRRYVPVLVEEGSNKWNHVGLHLKGGVGSGQPIDRKPSFSLHFGRFDKSETFHGIKRWQLNNCAQDPSYLNEVIASQMFRDAGVAAPRCTHARVELNGRDLGLYVFREGIDEHLLAQFFENPKGDLYQGKYTSDVTDALALSEDDPDTNFDFTQLKAQLDLPDTESRFREVSRLVDMEAFSRYLGLEVMTGHHDGYAMAVNNYRVFAQRPRAEGGTEPSGRLYLLPHGMDMMFSEPRSPILPCVGGKLARALLGSSSGRGIYWHEFGRAFTNCFSAVSLSNYVETFRVRIRPVFESMGSNALARQIAREDRLLSVLHQRRQHLASYLAQEPTAFRFSSPHSEKEILLPLDKWTPHEQVGSQAMFRTNAPGLGSMPALVIISQSTRSSAGGTWRQRIRLPRGKYRLEGTAEVLFSSQLAQMVPPKLFCQRTEGIRLLSSIDSRRLGKFSISSDPFQVTDENEVVELAVGCSGIRFGLLFHVATLRLVKP